MEDIDKKILELDNKLSNVNDYLKTCVTSNNVNEVCNNLYSKMKSQMITYLKELVNNNSSNNTVCNIDTYTRDEIDNKQFVTLKEVDKYYPTKNYVISNFVSKGNLPCNKCTCVKKSELDTILDGFITPKKLNDTLSSYYNKIDINAIIEDVKTFIPKDYVTTNILNTKVTSVLNHVKNNYVQKTYAENNYVNINYKQYVDNTYLRKENFTKETILGDLNLGDIVTTSMLGNYSSKEDIDILINKIQKNANNIENLRNMILAVNKNNFDNYYTKTDLNSNFVRREMARDTYLSKVDASKMYLSIEKAKNDYISKNEANSIFLRIEDYRNIATMLNISSQYKNNTSEEFLTEMKSGSVKDGIYTVGNECYMVTGNTYFKGYTIK